MSDRTALRPHAVRPPALRPPAQRCDRFGTYPDCPHCGGVLHAEHAPFKCRGCGWRDSCCD